MHAISVSGNDAELQFPRAVLHHTVESPHLFVDSNRLLFGYIVYGVLT